MALHRQPSQISPHFTALRRLPCRATEFPLAAMGPRGRFSAHGVGDSPRSNRLKAFMPSRIANLARLLMLTFVSPTAVKSPAQAFPADRSIQLAKAPFEVRLRKLHL